MKNKFLFLLLTVNFLNSADFKDGENKKDGEKKEEFGQAKSSNKVLFNNSLGHGYTFRFFFSERFYYNVEQVTDADGKIYKLSFNRLVGNIELELKEFFNPKYKWLTIFVLEKDKMVFNETFALNNPRAYCNEINSSSHSQTLITAKRDSILVYHEDGTISKLPAIKIEVSALK